MQDGDGAFRITAALSQAFSTITLVVGIAGIRSRVGTLGAPGWPTGSSTSTSAPTSSTADSTAGRLAPVRHLRPGHLPLNAEPVTRAYQATRQLTLANDQTAEAEHAYYGALKRFGLLDRLLVVRTASDFEDERPGTSPRASMTCSTPHRLRRLQHRPEHAYRVAWQLAHAL